MHMLAGRDPVMTHMEIAERIGITHRSVQRGEERALRKIRDALLEEGFDLRDWTPDPQCSPCRSISGFFDPVGSFDESGFKYE